MKRDNDSKAFFHLTDGRPPGDDHPLGRLGTTKERKTISLADDGLPFVAGIGHTRYAVAHAALPEHVHIGCIELHYCLCGSIDFEIEGRRHTLLPGEVCLTQPDMRHHLVSNAKGHQHYWLLLELPAARNAARAFGLPPSEAQELRRRLTSIRRPVFRVDDQMKQLFHELFETLGKLSHGTYRTLVLRTLLLRLLAILVQDAVRQANSPAAPSPLVQLVADIRTHPEVRRTIEGMARVVGRCESLFSSEFKRLTGFPPAAFIAHCRIQKARELLEKGDMSIAAISRTLGYSSVAHFSSQFRLFCGMSPRKYRTTASQSTTARQR